MVAMTMRGLTSRRKPKAFGDQEKFLARVTKTLQYGKYPLSDRTSLPMTELAAEIFSHAKNKLSLDYLNVEEAARLSRSASVSPCSLVLALLYLDRLKSSNPKYLAKVPSSQLFLISLMIGSKFIQDDGQDDEVNNFEWAKYGGLSVQEINAAEREFLNAINWEVFVNKELFWKRLESMERLIGLRQGCKRGWFSYTELDLLLQSAQLATLIKTLVNISLVCLASYTASVFALLGSTMLVVQVPGLAQLASQRISTCIPSVTHNSNTNQSLNTFAPSNPALSNLESITQILANRGVWNQTSEENCQFIETDTEFSVLNSNDDRLESFNFWMDSDETYSTWAHALQRYLVHDSMATILPTSRLEGI